ncbi:hypothetical protein [Herbaspirillum seropedicae]|uniref:hypothetical protein n=1 Tax=Herbaspirillum seropedicae TaxID=964 RepID=UPI003FCD7AA6
MQLARVVGFFIDFLLLLVHAIAPPSVHCRRSAASTKKEMPHFSLEIVFCLSPAVLLRFTASCRMADAFFTSRDARTLHFLASRMAGIIAIASDEFKTR